MSTPTQAFIPELFKTEFSNTLIGLPQQTSNRLWGTIPVTPISASEQMVDGIGTLKAVRITGRHPKLQAQEATFFRRRVDTEEVAVAVRVDPREMGLALMSPEVQGRLAKEALSAIYREFDTIFQERLFADVQYGRRGENTITAAADGVRTLDLTGGWTYETGWLELMQLFTSKEIGTEEGVKVIVGVTDVEQQIFLNTEKLINTRYGNSFTGSKGIQGFSNLLGFDLRTFGSAPADHDPIIPVVSGVRQCFAACTAGMLGVIRENIKVEWVDLRETTLRSMELRVTADIGMVRLLGSNIIRITTTA